MSGVMLHAILQLPISAWRDTQIDQSQRRSRYVQASDLIRKHEQQMEQLLISLKSGIPSDIVVYQLEEYLNNKSTGRDL